jgi:hypothetical protein
MTMDGITLYLVLPLCMRYLSGFPMKQIFALEKKLYVALRFNVANLRSRWFYYSVLLAL